MRIQPVLESVGRARPATHGPEVNGETNLIAAFGEDQVQRLAGITKAQLRHWDRTGLLSPTFGFGDLRAAFGRIYSFRDVVALRVLGTLRNKHGVSVQHLRSVKERLAQPGTDVWTGVRLYVLNKKVIWVEPDTELPQEVASGQYLVPTIELDAIVASTKAEMQELSRRSPQQVGQVERRKFVQHSTPVVAGTRIPVRALQRFHQAGYSVAQILEEYPDLTEEDVKAALAYKLAA